MDGLILTNKAQTAQACEVHIQHCGAMLAKEYARYEATGCFSHRGSADGWRMNMERAIAARSPLTVAVMEAARGLS